MYYFCVVLVGFVVICLVRVGWVGWLLNMGFGVMVMILNIFSYVSVFMFVVLGFVIVFGLMDIVNFVYVEWVMMGVYILVVV